MAPDRVTNIETWVQYSKRYINIVRRPRDGALLVLNPANMDLENPAKEIPFTKAVDAIAYLATGENSNIRAQAATRMATIASERATAIQVLNTTIRQKQRELLDVHRSWVMATASQNQDSATAVAAATAAAALQRELADLDRLRQETRYPHRFIQSRQIARMDLDYETKDERIMGMQCLNVMNTVAADRQILIGGDTA